jgi:hypothetical protein
MGMGQCVATVGGTTRKVFEAYVEQLLSPGLESGQVVVIDNLPTHRGERLIEVRGCELLYLRRPYSPDRRDLLEDQGPIAAGWSPREVLGGAGRDPVGGQYYRCPGLLRPLRLPSSGALIVNYSLSTRRRFGQLALVNRNFISQVLGLFGRRGGTQHLVAVRVAPEARYDVVASPSLVEVGLVEPSETRRGVGNFLLTVAGASLMQARIRSARAEARRIDAPRTSGRGGRCIKSRA